MWSRAYILLYLFIYRSGFSISSFAFLDYLFDVSDLAFLLLNEVEKYVCSKKEWSHLINALNQFTIMLL